LEGSERLGWLERLSRLRCSRWLRWFKWFGWFRWFRWFSLQLSTTKIAQIIDPVGSERSDGKNDQNFKWFVWSDVVQAV